MSYVFHTDTDPEQLDEFVIHSEQNNIFQCHKWADVKNNWDHMFTSVTEDDEIVATAVVLIRKLPLGLTLFYVPRGPVMDYHNEELVTFFLDHLKEQARKRHAIVLRFDPKIYSRKYPYKERHEKHPYENTDIIEMLKRYGAKHRGYTTLIKESTQPRFNAEMDVEPDYYELLERKTVRSIEIAKKKGAIISEGPENLDDFATAMHFTEVRKHVALRNKEYFQNMVDVYGDDALVLVARIHFQEQIAVLENRIAQHESILNQKPSRKVKAKEERELKEDQAELEKVKADYAENGDDEMILSGVLAVHNPKMMEIFYMGNNPRGLRTRASYLLYNACLQYCAEHGIKECSFGGMEGTLDDGLTLFKSNWIMNVEEYIGEFNIVLNPLMYKAFDEIYPKILQSAAKMRSRKGND